MTAEIDWEIQKQSDRESDWSVDRSSNPVPFSTGIKDQSIGKVDTPYGNHPLYEELVKRKNQEPVEDDT